MESLVKGSYWKISILNVLKDGGRQYEKEMGVR